MRTSCIYGLMVATLLAAGLLVSCGKEDQRQRSEAISAPSVQMFGGMNQWLSDGKVGLLVAEFGLDPTGPTSSPADYYRIGFTVKNFTDRPLELHKVSVKFLTSDLTETVRQRLGDGAGGEVKPFENEINWTRSLDDPRASRVAHVVGPLAAEQLESSGHFCFGVKDPTVTITLHRAHAVVGGPFRVLLGRTLPGASPMPEQETGTLRAGAFVCRTFEALGMLDRGQTDPHNQAMVQVLASKTCFTTEEAISYTVLERIGGRPGRAKLLLGNGEIVWTYPKQLENP